MCRSCASLDTSSTGSVATRGEGGGGRRFKNGSRRMTTRPFPTNILIKQYSVDGQNKCLIRFFKTLKRIIISILHLRYSHARRHSRTRLWSGRMVVVVLVVERGVYDMEGGARRRFEFAVSACTRSDEKYTSPILRRCSWDRTCFHKYSNLYAYER